MHARARVAAGVAVTVAALLSARTAPAVSSFVEFESGQVRPLALSPSGGRLFAVNTPDDRLEIFDVGAGGLTHSGSVPVGLEPVAVAARTDTEVWVVNHLSDSVSIVDVPNPPDPTNPPHVVRTLLVGDEPRDIVFANPGGNRAFITCAHRGQNRPGDPQLTTAGIGRADVWVFDATNLGPATLGGTPVAGTPVVLFGDTPRALAVSNDKNTVFAAVFHSGNQTTAINEGAVCNGGASAGSCVVGQTGNQATMPGGLPAPNQNFQHTAQHETGIIVKFDGTHWTDRLGRNWDPAVRFSLPDQDVFALNATGSPPAATGTPFGHVGTVLFNMAVKPGSGTPGTVYVTNTDAHNEVRFEGPGTFASMQPGAPSPFTVRGHLHEARITVLSGSTVTARHLNKHIDYNVVPSPAGVKDNSLATPVGMAFTSDGSKVYVAAFGSSKVGVFNTTLLENDMFVPSSLDHIVLSGGGPSGLVLDEANNRLYVLTRFNNSVAVVDTTTAAEVPALAQSLHNPEPPSITDGRRVLYDAYNTSSNGEAACAACHVFGDFDSLAWDLGNPDDVVLNNPNPFRVGPFIDPNFHPLKGPMTTQTLRGMANDGPMHWRGDRTGGNDPGGNALDENAAFLKFIVAFGGLLGRGSAISGTDMQAFADFILQVMLPPNPNRALDNSLTSDQQTAKNFFNNTTSDTVQTCNGCHALNPANGNFGTDGFSSFENETQVFKIPHLRNLYQKIGMFGFPAIGDNNNTFINPGNNGCVTGAAGCPTASSQPAQVRGFGFLHDGSVDTLFRFHNATVFNGGFGGTTPAADTLRRQVEQFMLAFDSNLAPIVGQQVTLTSSNGGADGTGGTAGPRITLMLARAAAGECDVVAKGDVIVSPTVTQQRGWVRLSSGMFQSDRTGESLLSDSQLRMQSHTAGQELTYTAVPVGSGTRIGIDRDGDGFPDRTELDMGTDPTDPFSFPGATTTTTNAGTTSTTITSTSTTTSTTQPSSGPSGCTGKKFSVAGKKITSRAKCYSKAAAQGVTVDSGCLNSAAGKFNASWTKLEKPGNDCRTTGDVSSIENLVDAFTDGLVNALEPNGTQTSRCTAKKLVAAGKKAAAKGKCYGKAATTGVGVDGTCLTKASTKFSTTWSKLEGPGNDCLTTGDVTDVENSVDSFVAQLVGDLEP